MKKVSLICPFYNASDCIGRFLTSIDELFACIDEALLNDKTGAAQQAREKMLQKHTFDVRMKEVLNVLFDGKNQSSRCSESTIAMAETNHRDD